MLPFVTHWKLTSLRIWTEVSKSSSEFGLFLYYVLCLIRFTRNYFISSEQIKITVHRLRSLWCVTYRSAIFLWWYMFSNYRHLSSLCSPWRLLWSYIFSLRYPYAAQHYKEWHHRRPKLIVEHLYRSLGSLCFEC